MAKTYLALIPAAFLALMAACSSDGVPSMPAIGGATGAAGQTGAGATGVSGSAGANPGAAGAASGNAGAAGAAASAGAGGQSTAGAGGAAPTAGAGGMSGGVGAGGAPGKVRSGPSAGCGKDAPSDDSTTKFIKHEVHMTGIAARFLGPNPKGADYKTSGGYDYTFRPYSVKLPTGYDKNTKYTVVFGGGGCGGSAANFASSPGDGFSMEPKDTTIHIGMSYVDTCFEDDGVDNAEVPYFRAIMADIEQKYCFDLSKVFVGGYSSGGWESYQLGCAASDLVRGIGAEEGGLRAQHPPCKNPVAAVLVAGEADMENPIGPLDITMGKGKDLDSYGSGPSKDEILMRNGCVGTDTKPVADPKYPQCKQYTGCPAAYPVVWCSLPGVGHNNSTYNGTNYSPGPMWGILGSLPAP